MRVRLLKACLTGLLALAALPATADTYPSKTIRIIVPFAPGGATDALARAVAQKLGESVGQAVVVDNRGGAGGNIGTDMVAKAPADGYTLLLTINSHVVNSSLYKSLPYDPIKDFQPLTLVATAPNVLAASPAFSANTIAELIAMAKAKPDTITFGSAGSGSGSHLAGVLFDSMAGVKMIHVPYKGVTPAIVDLMGGQVNLCFSVLSVVYPYMKDGNKLKVLALTSAKRSPLVPQVPTIGESGLKGYDVFSWFGLLLPANPPQEVMSKLQGELTRILQLPELKSAFAAQGLDLVGNSPEEFGKFLKSDQLLWGKVIKANNIRLE